MRILLLLTMLTATSCGVKEAQSSQTLDANEDLEKAKGLILKFFKPLERGIAYRYENNSFTLIKETEDGGRIIVEGGSDEMSENDPGVAKCSIHLKGVHFGINSSRQLSQLKRTFLEESNSDPICKKYESDLTQESVTLDYISGPFNYELFDQVHSVSHVSENTYKVTANNDGKIDSLEFKLINDSSFETGGVVINSGAISQEDICSYVGKMALFGTVTFDDGIDKRFVIDTIENQEITSKDLLCK